jgi:hypothetical protein
MSCQRTQEIDLLEFLANPRAGEFDAFRKHYPVCPECASEVRVWTELHQQLAASEPHPAPDVLLRFEDDPAGLPPERRSAIERHVASCVPCRDELRALRAFDPSAALAPAAGLAGSRLAAAVTWLRRLLWHPALAYALVLILLAPILIETWDEATSPRLHEAPAPADGKLALLEEPAVPSAAEPAFSVREALVRDIPLEDKRAPELGLASRREKLNQPGAPTAPKEKLEAQVTAPKTDRARAVAEPVAQRKARLAKRAEADALDAVAPLAQAEEAEQEPRETEALLSDEDAQGALARAHAPARGDAVNAPPELLLMRRSGSFERKLGTTDFAASGLRATVERELPVALEGDLLVLFIPTPTLAEGQDEIDVQVVHANGRRRLRELVPVDPGQPVTLLRIPAALFETGSHAAVVRVPGDPPSAIRQFDYTFRVN